MDVAEHQKNLTQRRKGAKVRRRIEIAAEDHNDHKRNNHHRRPQRSRRLNLRILFVAVVLFCELSVS